MKRDLDHFKRIKNFVGFSYSNFGYSLQVHEKQKTSRKDPLGYCYKYTGDSVVIYNIVCSLLGRDHTDYRVKMHEYGHIYLGHLDGIHEELDGRIIWTIQNYRADLINYINKNCGIDYGDKLLNRVIDDPGLNHELHNIAMDMEVNSKVLSKEDVEEMEEDITDVEIRSSDSFKNMEKYASMSDEEIDQDTTLSDEQKEVLKKTRDEIKKSLSQSKIKLIVPERYHFPDGTPFPNDLTYAEYLILIIKYMDQFVKMLVNISQGGNGDTSNVTSEDLQQALGNGNGMQSLDDLMNQCGMSSGQGNSGDKYKGTRDDNNNNQPGDHGSDSRDEADKKRKEGKLSSSGGEGCGSSGGATGELDSENESTDPIDIAIEEVIKNFKNKVFSWSTKRDQTYLYNRGINRTVIAPIYRNKTSVTTKPKIVFLLDVSGSMNTSLVNRIIHQIARKMKAIKTGTTYDIIAWSTVLCSHHKNIDPRKPTPKIRLGGGTRMAKGIEYFKENYGKESIMVLISDFEDYLEEWDKVSLGMSGYDLYAFNYGWKGCNKKFKNIKVKNFKP